MTDRRGDWIQCYSGIRFWPLDPRPEDVRIDDIAFALAHTNRFNGHCGTYSVGEHSVRVSWLLGERGADRKLALAGLLHDAAEAYVSDLPRPLKQSFRSLGFNAYDDAETAVIGAIETAFGLPVGICSSSSVKHADAVLLATERRDLFRHTLPWGALPEPLSERIAPWPVDAVTRVFLERFSELTDGD